MEWLWVPFAIHGVSLAGWEWIVIGAGALGGLRLIARGRRRQLPPPNPQVQIAPPPPKAVPAPKKPKQVLPEMSRLAANRLPPSVQMKINQIRRKVEAILQYSEEFPVGSEDLYLVEHTATDYLPQTLDAYLRLPPASHNQPVEPGGKTAWEELWSQLNLMEQKLDQVAAVLKRKNADELLANGKFLEERFNPGSPDFDAAPEKP
ncbi:MAG: hypothetical protein ACREQM_02970 [Candidatus Dormibacteraceae bacterium]